MLLASFNQVEASCSCDCRSRHLAQCAKLNGFVCLKSLWSIWLEIFACHGLLLLCIYFIHTIRRSFMHFHFPSWNWESALFSIVAGVQELPDFLWHWFD